VVALNGPVGRNVLVDLAVVPKFRILGRNVLADPKARTFGRSVRVVLVRVLKFRTVVPNAPLRVRSRRTFDRNAPVVLVRVLKFRAVVPNAPLRVRSRRTFDRNAPAMQLARVAGIVTRLAHVRINLCDSNPAMQLIRVVDIVTRLVRELIGRDIIVRAAAVVEAIGRAPAVVAAAVMVAAVMAVAVVVAIAAASDPSLVASG